MKIGDKVRIRKHETRCALEKELIRAELIKDVDYYGCKGIIIGNEKDENCYRHQRYTVRLEGIVCDLWFCYDELEVIE